MFMVHIFRIIVVTVLIRTTCASNARQEVGASVGATESRSRYDVKNRFPIMIRQDWDG